MIIAMLLEKKGRLRNPNSPLALELTKLIHWVDLHVPGRRVHDKNERHPQYIKTVTIAGHAIEYWYTEDVDVSMNEIDIEHVKRLLSEGFVEGELITTSETNPQMSYYGWWKYNNRR